MNGSVRHSSPYPGERHRPKEYRPTEWGQSGGGTRPGGSPSVEDAEAYEMVLAELCSALFASLPRRDQRRKGVEYVRGLLLAEGRKSIRNIARLVDSPANEQNLHHFISSSTWDWIPVRQALADYLVRVAVPQAWVVRPTVIPKAGAHSVGVDRRFIPSVGQVLSAQQAVGVWAASEQLSMPVNWRLHLPRTWLDDEPRRSLVAIPDEVDTETLSECAAEALISTVRGWQLPIRPVVLDAREPDGMKAVRRLREAGLPLLVRVSATLPLTSADPVPAGHSAELLPAHQLLAAARSLMYPVSWSEHAAEPVLRTGAVTAVRVGPPWAGRSPGAGPTEAGEEMLLLGAATRGRGRRLTEFWLSDLVDAPPAALFRLSRLIDRVDQDFEEITDRVGIRDFAGRSFTGWHRHATLASAAHLVAALTRTGGRPLRYAS